MEVQNEEEVEDHLNEHRSPANEMCLQPVIPDYPIVTVEHNSNNSTGKNMSDEEVESLSYDERCRLLNLNPVIVAKHFQYRVETLFIEIY